MPWRYRTPSRRALSTSGYLSVSQAGGVAVGVPKMTFIPFASARSKNSSQKAKVNWPSWGSTKLQANSAMRMVVMPWASILSKSLSHRDLSQCSG